MSEWLSELGFQDGLVITLLIQLCLLTIAFSGTLTFMLIRTERSLSKAVRDTESTQHRLDALTKSLYLQGIDPFFCCAEGQKNLNDNNGKAGSK